MSALKIDEITDLIQCGDYKKLKNVLDSYKGSFAVYYFLQIAKFANDKFDFEKFKDVLIDKRPKMY